MYIGVKAVVPQEDYKLLLTFDNDEQRTFDMKPYLEFGAVYHALKFHTVRLVFKTVEWANRADINPKYCIPTVYPVNPPLFFTGQ